jgi:hypothetical protein
VIDTVELTTSAEAPNVDATPTVEPSDDPAATTDAGGKVTGHARVAQNIQRHVDHMITKEASRIDRLLASQNVSEAGAGAIAGLKSTFDAAVTGFAAGYSSDSSAPPSVVLAQIRAAIKTLHSGIRDALASPAPATPIDPPVVPVDPVPIDSTPIDPGTPVQPVDGPAASVPTGAQVIAAYTASNPRGSLSLVA